MVDLHRRHNRSSKDEQDILLLLCPVKPNPFPSGLALLQAVTLEDLSAKPDKLLILEYQRIEQLAKSTDIAWAQIESSPGL
ncbi:hypothetical protein V8E54_001519 [Elaphomyces granulatus]